MQALYVSECMSRELEEKACDAFPPAGGGGVGRSAEAAAASDGVWEPTRLVVAEALAAELLSFSAVRAALLTRLCR